MHTNGTASRSTNLPSGVMYPMSNPPGSRRWSGLDGLRALAVVAVVFFHFEPAVLPGGFLGVDVFFVLSGYLITRMIATEYLRTGRFRFGAFYLRRARRLLPGVAVVLVAVLAASAFWRDQLSTVRGATAAAAAYVSNWWLSYAHQSYFVTAGRPSMLQHLWSLAVEEQFYLVWPVIAIGVLALVGRRAGPDVTPARRARWLAIAAGGLAVASAAEMATLAVLTNAPYDTDASRLYYGTDTHSMGLLLGAAFGALAAGRSRPRPGAGVRPARRRVWFTDLIAAGALVTLTITVCVETQSTPALYRGGFLVVAAVAALATAAVARAGSRIGWALDRRPLRWLAARSYAIYLWHWPVAVVTRPGVDVHWPGPMVLLVRLTATIGLADLTYRFVESPVRRIGLRESARRASRRLARVVVGQAPVGARLATAALVTGVLVAVGVLAAGPKPTLSAGQRALAATPGGRSLPIGRSSIPAAPAPLGRVASRLEPGASVPSVVSTRPSTTAAAAPPAAPGGTPARTKPRLPSISAFGDSVMLGARTSLDEHFPGGTLDAVEGRQPDPILRDIEHDQATGRLNPLVVIGVGDNGLISPDALEHALACLHGVHQVIVLNNRVGRAWQDPNNKTIAAIVPHFVNVTLLDWHALSAAHPTWFYEDGIHLTPQGAAAYTALIVKTAKPV